MVNKRRLEPGEPSGSRHAEALHEALAEAGLGDGSDPPAGTPAADARLDPDDASLAGRIGAWLIDGGVVYIAVNVAARLDTERFRAVRYFSDPDAARLTSRRRVHLSVERPTHVMLIVLAALLAVAFVVVVALTGRTLGKALVGLRIVRLDGTPVGWGESLIRNGVALTPWLAFAARNGVVSWIALVWSVVIFISVVVDRRHRGLHDRAAGTVVVRIPSRLRPSPSFSGDEGGPQPGS